MLPEPKYATPVNPVQRNLFTKKREKAPIGAHHSFPRSVAPYNNTTPHHEKLYLVDQTRQSWQPLQGQLSGVVSEHELCTMYAP